MGACGSSDAQGPDACSKPGMKSMEDAAETCVISSLMSLGVQPNKNKRMRCDRGKLDVAGAGLGYTCRKGQKQAAAYPNQDSWSVHRFPGEIAVYSVFDGHGTRGHSISDRARQHFHRHFVANPARLGTPEVQEVLKSAFKRAQESFEKVSEARDSGCTATIAVHDRARGLLTIAHAGDSAAVIGRSTGSEGGKLQAATLTRDHQAGLEDERERITKAGGVVRSDGYKSRVFKRGTNGPGLAVTRCLGDTFAHRTCGVSAVPEISEHSVTAADELLLVCSDGIWEVIEPQEAVDLVTSYGRDDGTAAADALAAEARRRWLKGTGSKLCDDITVVLAHLHGPDGAVGLVVSER